MKVKKLLSIILAVVLCLSALSISASAGEISEIKVTETTAKLQFNKNGSFKIIQISDIQDNEFLPEATLDYIRAVAVKEQPDLFVLTGDNISAGVGKKGIKLISNYTVRKAIDNFMSVFEEIGVPVAVVFGNHDGEGQVKKEEQMKIYQSYKCCVAVDEGINVYGCGTYNLPILSSDGKKVAYNIWCFDSNMYDEVNGGYDYVHADQVQWYLNKSRQLQRENDGELVPSIAFQHIIVNEVNDAIRAGCILPGGVINENPCPGTVWGTQFSAMQSRGDVKAMFFGHDHVNAFVAPYEGIDIVNTPTGGFGSYGDRNRGVRVIELDEKNTDTYNTRLINYYDTFCVDSTSTARYIMNAGEYSTGTQVWNGFRYLFLALRNNQPILTTLYEIFCAFA